MSSKKKEEVVARSDSGAVSAEVASLHQSLMGRESTDARDIILPKILLMQGLSKAVADAKAVMGEMRDSLDYKLIGSKDKPVEVIPFHSTKTWIVFERDRGDKLEYKQQVEFGPENATWEWDAVVDGKKVRRDQSLNFYVLLASEIASGMFMPYLVSFRRTSYTAGKKLVTAREKMRMFKRPLASKVFNLQSVKRENDQGTFYVYDISEARDSSTEEMQAVAPWFDMVQSTNVKVDDSDLRDEATVSAPDEDDTASMKF